MLRIAFLLMSLLLLSSCFSQNTGGETAAVYKKIKVEFEEISLAEGESDIFQLLLDKPSVDNMILKWKITGPQASSRFVYTEGTVSVSKNSESVPVQIQSSEDSVYNPELIYTIELENLSDIRQLLTLESQNFTLLDNDPKPEVSFSSASNSVIENTGQIPIYVSLSAEAGKNLEIYYSLHSSSTADASDLVRNESFQIPANTTSHYFNITIVDDVDVEGVENLVLVLDSAKYAEIDIPISSIENQHDITIHDNESTLINDPSSLTLNDASANTGYARNTNVSVAIDEDPVTTKWCLSELQTTKPIDGLATCVGGTGADNGWYTLANEGEPTDYNLSAGDVIKTVYIWTANVFEHVNPNPVSATIVLDTVAPTVSLTKASGQSDPASSLAVNFTASFSEEVSGGFIVTNKGTALWASGTLSTSDNISFNWAVDNVASNGSLSAEIAAGVTTDLAGNPNVASTNGPDNSISLDLSEGKKIYRSIGIGSTSALMTGSDLGGNNLKIDSSGTAIWEKSLDLNIGIGDALVYDSDGNSSMDSIAFIQKRYSTKEMKLVNESGASLNSEVLVGQDWNIYRSYTSMANAVDGLTNSGISVAFDTWSGGRDLVTNNESWTFTLFADAPATSSASLDSSSWKTSGFQRLRFIVPETVSQVGISQRHQGIWDTSKFHWIQSGASESLNTNDVSFVEVEGIQISPNQAGIGGGDSAIRTNAKYFSLISSIIKDSGSGDSVGVYSTDAGDSLRVFLNNLIFDFDDSGDRSLNLAGIDSSSKNILINNSLTNCHSVAIHTAGSSVEAFNNIVQCNNSGSQWSGSNYLANSDFNLSSDLTAPGTNPQHSVNLSFNDASNGDYRLAVSDSAQMNLGADHSSLYSKLNFDLAGRERITGIDLGALQANLDSFTWIGTGGDTLWSNAANWHGGVSPGASDIAVFNYLCASNCDAEIDIAAPANGLIMESGFPGNISQSPSLSVTIGDYGLRLYSGTYDAGSATNSLRLGSFKQYGGDFVAPDGDFLIYQDFANGFTKDPSYFLRAGGSYTRGGGKLKWNPRTGSCDESTIFRVYNYFPTELDSLEIDVDSYDCHGLDDAALYFSSKHDDLIVHEDLETFDGRIYWGTIQLKGNYIGHCSSGSDVNGKCLSLDNTLHVVFNNTSVPQEYSGDGPSPTFVIDNSFGVSPSVGNTNFHLTALHIEQGNFTAPTGILTIGKQVHVQGAKNTARSRSDFLIHGGDFLHNNGHVRLQPFHDACDDYRASGSGYISSYTGNISFNTLDLDITQEILGGCHNQDDIRYSITNNTVIEVAGNMQFIDGRLEGGEVHVAGDLSFLCADGSDAAGACVGIGTTRFVANGTSLQTINIASGVNFPGDLLKFDNPSQVNIADNLLLNSSGQSLELAQGVLNLGGELNVSGNLHLEAGTQLNTYCNSVNYSSLSGTGTINGGTGSPSIGIADVSATEDNDLEFIVSLDNFSCSGDITVDYETENSSAFTFDGDYSISSGTLTLIAGEQQASLIVSVNDDGFWEANEELYMNISNASGASITDFSATGTIIDNDSATATHIWTGAAADDNWSSTANWSSGSVPGAGDIAYFHGASCSNCNARIDVPTSIQGIRSFSDYTGTITQAVAADVSLSSGGFYMEAGNFIGSSSAITIDGFFYHNTDSFTAGTGEINTKSHVHLSGGTHDFSAATLRIQTNTTGQNYFLDSLVFDTIYFRNNEDILFNASAITVNSLVDVDNSSTSDQIDNGLIHIKGNVLSTGSCGGGLNGTKFIFDGTTDQEIRGTENCSFPFIEVNKASGTLNLQDHLRTNASFVVLAGNVEANSSVLTMVGTSNTANIEAPGTSFYDVRLLNGRDVNIVSDMTIENQLEIDLEGGSSRLEGNGIIDLKGNVVNNRLPQGGSVLLRFSGSGTQTINSSTNMFPSIEIASSGTVVFPADFYVQGDFTYTSGTVDTTGSTVRFTTRYAQAVQEIDSLGVSFNNVVIQDTASVNEYVILLSDMDVNGNLEFIGEGDNNLQSSVFRVAGNLSVDFDTINSTHYPVVLDGSGTQILSNPGVGKIGSLEIASTGNVELASDFSVGGDFTYTSGSIDQKGFAFHLNSQYSSTNFTVATNGYEFEDIILTDGSGASEIFLLASDVIVNGDLEINGAGNNGAGFIANNRIFLRGNYSQIPVFNARTLTSITFDGNSDQRINLNEAKFLFSNFTVNKSSGTLYLDSDVDIFENGQDLDLQQGTVRMSANDLNVDNNLNLAAGTSLYQDCGSLSYTSLSGTGSLYNGNPNPNISVLDSSVDEAEAGLIIVDIGLPNCSATVRVDFEIVDDSATRADYDYTASSYSGTLSFSPGEYQKVITIQTTDDSIMEPDEDVLVDFTSPINATMSDMQAKLTIQNDDISTFIWTGSGPNSNWSTAANWQGGTIPTSSDVAFFDTSCGANCDVIIDSSIDVLGIRVDSAYPGAIIQASSSEIQIGTGDFLLSGGSFVGSDANIHIDGHLKIDGTSFTSTSAMLSIGRSSNSGILDGLELTSTGTYLHNNGEIRFVGEANVNCGDSAANRLVLEKNINFYDFQVRISDKSGGGCSSSNRFNDAFLEILGSSKVIVNNSFVFSDGYIKSGEIDLLNQSSITCEDGDYFSSFICAGGGDVKLNYLGAGTQTINVQQGAWLPVVVVNSGQTVSMAGADSGVFLRSLEVLSGHFIAPTTGLTFLSPYSNSYGVGRLNVSPGASYTASNNTIIKSSKVVHCAGIQNSFLLDVDGSQTFENLTIEVVDAGTGACVGNANQVTLDIGTGDTVIVNGNLNLIDGHFRYGSIELKGNLDINCEGDNPTDANLCVGGGSTNILFNGTSMQSLSLEAGAEFPFANLSLNNSAGYQLNSNSDLNNANLFVISGDLDMNFFDLIGINDISNYSGTITKQATENLIYNSCLGGPVGPPCPN